MWSVSIFVLAVVICQAFSQLTLSKTRQTIRDDDQLGQCRRCENGGFCANIGEGLQCQCPDGYTGRQCQTKTPLLVSPELFHPLSSGLVEGGSFFALAYNRTANFTLQQDTRALQNSKFFTKYFTDSLNKAFGSEQSLQRNVQRAEKVVWPMTEEARKEYEEALGKGEGLLVPWDDDQPPFTVRGDVLTVRDNVQVAPQPAVADLPRPTNVLNAPVLQTRPVSKKRFFRGKRQASATLALTPFWAWVIPCAFWPNLLWRTADGSCNRWSSNWGKSGEALTRCLNPDYDDNIASPRTLSHVSGLPLPGARQVSRAVHPDIVGTTQLTTFVMLMGQFIDHDIVSTPLPVATPYLPLTCCPAPGVHPDCFPITFPAGDPNFDGECMNFVRSAPSRNAFGIPLVPRENDNAITSFIDASNVYGSTQAQQDNVRDPANRHLLRTSTGNFPPDNGHDDCVKRPGHMPPDICFLCGDDRANENPGLTLLHTVFMRYHNNLATQLRAVSPFTSNDVIFQQVKAIVSAVMQNIVYDEWLPIVLGPSVRAMKNLDLPGSASSRTTYDSSKDPRIFQAFSTAAFRFGHSLIPRSMLIEPGRRVLLRELFFTPYETREHLDTLAQGLLSAPDPEDRAQPADRHLVDEVTGHLFENQEGEMKGFDLAALNIQRGRDHGLPPYNAFRQLCGLSNVTTFCDPILGMSGGALSNAYSHPDDIDLFAGGASEPAFDGGLVGETFSHLIAKQFENLKDGDRFFFTHNRFLFGFTNTQIQRIRQITLSHVLCDTTALSFAQPNAFRAQGPGNFGLSCGSYTQLNMNEFRWYPFF